MSCSPGTLYVVAAAVLSAALNASVGGIVPRERTARSGSSGSPVCRASSLPDGPAVCTTANCRCPRPESRGPPWPRRPCTPRRSSWSPSSYSTRRSRASTCSTSSTDVHHVERGAQQAQHWTALTIAAWSSAVCPLGQPGRQGLFGRHPAHHSTCPRARRRAGRRADGHLRRRTRHARDPPPRCRWRHVRRRGARPRPRRPGRPADSVRAAHAWLGLPRPVTLTTEHAPDGRRPTPSTTGAGSPRACPFRWT